MGSVLRIVLAVVFVVSYIASAHTGLTSQGNRFDLAHKGANPAAAMLAEIAEAGETEPIGHALPASVLCPPARADTMRTTPGLDERTHRHRPHNDLYSLNLVLLI
ncbi:MAG: hypothetical protein FJ145_13380 [Deltaproteobacteria bacterium]|nr:hypothetical protein [Deltaproteobacteria bacterium]